ncbi:hypothetical protein Bca4012_052470 [Brassica carinata]|uniref:DUF1216 domain-containing protein n=1 Tax=Brassica oleracea var. oleracea TaxID=109376 RepID=A0A0D3AWF6_BRAOL|nr:PREDICTED: uncharacterized protein LOC106326075 isoform X1 [Brassica oleracea var. oleracea]XP_013675535.2 uncharacterized protein BNAC02G37530D [Brassica napus]
MADKNVLAICLMFLVASSVVYEAQGTFLLKMYLRRKMFRRARDFTPFACKGMLFLIKRLRGGCPATREFKKFFSLFTSYVKFISNASATSKSTDTQITSQVNGLASAMSELTAVKGRAPSNTDFRDAMLSMGKTLIEQKKSGSQSTTFQQRKELVVALVQWTKTITILVKTAVELRVGKSMDISKLGLDVDVNSIVGSERIQTGSSNTKTGSQSNISTSGSVTTTRFTKTGSNNQTGVRTETGSSNIKNGSQSSGLSP